MAEERPVVVFCGGISRIRENILDAGVVVGCIEAPEGRDRLMNHGLPMLHARRTPEHVTGPDFLNGAAPALSPAKSRGHDQVLSERVRVPGGAGAGLEGHAAHRNAGWVLGLNDRIDADRSGEIFLRSLLGGA